MKQVWSSRFISSIIQIETIILLKGKMFQLGALQLHATTLVTLRKK